MPLLTGAVRRHTGISIDTQLWRRRAPAVPGQGAALTRLAPRLLSIEALAALFFVLVVDYPTTIKLGANSLSAAITIALTALLLLLLGLNLLVAHGRITTRARLAMRQGLRGVPYALIAFALYAIFRLAVDANSDGTQNTFCYVMFILSILVAASSLSFDYRRVIRLMAWCSLGSSLIYLVQQVALNTGEGGKRPFISDRSFAMSALIGLAVLIPAKRRVGDPNSPPRSPLWPFFILLVLLFSLSRTALIVSMVLLLFLAVRAKKQYRALAVMLAAFSGVALAAVVAAVYPPIVSRFTEGDNAEVGGVRMNTSGRTELWSITYDSALRAPVWGHGPGNSTTVISRFFSVSGIGHPHNDYLRIFNDFGLVGLVLFWGGMLTLLVRCWRRALRQDEIRHWSAVMAILSVMLVAITDNVIVYQFIMMPVGVLIGISLRAGPEAIQCREWRWAASYRQSGEAVTALAPVGRSWA